MKITNVKNVAIAILTLTSSASAFWRMPCRARSGLARIDPIVDPGEISQHVHAIHGGGNFGPNANYTDLLDSDCTSCGVYEDKSAYWTPALYFMYANGTTVLVNQVGGMLAYYFLYTDGTPNATITPFPPGFQMLAGDSSRRNFTCAIPEPPKSLWNGYEITQPALEQKALGFNCLNYVDPTKTEGSLERHFMPNKTFLDENCLDGLRLELMFPSCWNGVDLDSPNHKSHMAYPELVMTGYCPENYTTRLPSLFYETIWDTTEFNGTDGSFVLSNGDPTGFGYHGDFVGAWDVGVLENAVDVCTNLSGMIQDCPLFTIQTDADAALCNFTLPSSDHVLAADDVFGPREGLPGGVVVQSGPAPATVAAATTASTPAPLSSSSASDVGATGVPLAVLPSSSPSPAVAASSAAAVSADAVATTTSPEVTPVPSSTSQTSPSFATTMWSTASDEVWEILVEVITVTKTPGAGGYQHHHHRRHGRIGGGM